VAGIFPRCRGVALCAMVAALCLASAPAAFAEEEPPRKLEWLADQGAAMAQARKLGKLLLIVHLSGDFAENAPDSRPSQVFHSITAADPAVVDELSERFVLAWRQVGAAQSLQQLPALKKGEKPPAPLEFAITYVCLPDGRVLHFIPGYLSSAELLTELTWAEKCYSACAGLSDEEQPLAVRNAHLASVAKADHTLFARRFPSRWKEDALAEGPSTVDLPAALAAARAAHAESLAQRLGTAWPAAAGPARLKALAAHGSLGRELSHLVLAEFPLVAHGDLARPAYEAATGQRFWEASRRREELAQWWQAARKREQPMLVVVADDPFSPARTSETYSWPPAGAESLAALPRYATQVVSVDELAALLHDAGEPPIVLRGAKPLPRYLLYNAAGKRTELSPATNVSRLAQALHAALGTGARASAASATKGESDEK
jgi:hypothetical protein